MNEPSVLDYVKSIFKSWDSFQDFLQAVFEQRDTTEMDEFRERSELQTMVMDSSLNIADESSSVTASRNLPWLSLGILIVALAAQSLFEPPQQLYAIGLGLYVIMLVLMGVAFWQSGWRSSRLPASERRLDLFNVRGIPFVLSLIFSAATFYMMSGNRFNSINVSLWILTIFFHVLAFWVPKPATAQPVEEIASRERNKRLLVRGLLFGIVVASALFFGFYKLDTIPGDMTSDHAEKLLDVYDITQGQYSIFFTRNTGREPLQFYLTAFLSQWFGVSFLSLKISTVFMGMLSLIYIFLLGRELGGERVAWLAVAFAAIGCWPVLIDRIGLRFAYYPPFTAATLYYFIRGLRLQRRNEFILAGIALGIGLNGYTPMRIVPIALIVFFIVYYLHLKDATARKQALVWFGLLAFTAWVFVIPLARYALENPVQFGSRAFSRLGTVERPFPGPVWLIFLQNFWVGLKTFNWYGGNIWTFTLPSRPALDVISGALFLIGVILLIVRYLRQRSWQDMILLLSIPLLQLPSTLSLAFPNENPALNRMSAAFVPAFVLVGIAIDGIWTNLVAKRRNDGELETPSSFSIRSGFAVVLTLGLFAASFLNNYDLVFRQYDAQFKYTNWNTRDMGLLMKDFADKGGSPDQAWVVPYPYWADTRLPMFWAGTIYRGETALTPDQFPETLSMPGAKLFIVNINDEASLQILQTLYPEGVLTLYQSVTPTKEFYVFRVGMVR